MKSKRKHDLQTNTLADWLGNHLETAKPYLPIIAIALIAIPALVWLWSYMSQRSEAEAGKSWTAYYEAMSLQDPETQADKLTKFVEKEADSPATPWAMLSVADTKTRLGIQKHFRDRTEANSLLAEAEKHYQTVLDKSEDNPLLKYRAWFGLAQVNEAQGKLDAARKSYQEIIAASPDSAHGKRAKRRLLMLVDPTSGEIDPETGEIDLATCKTRDSIVEFYEAYAKYEPKDPADFQVETPPFDPDQFSIPSLDFPGSETFSEVSAGGGDFPGGDVTPKEGDPTTGGGDFNPGAGDPMPKEPEKTEPEKTEPEKTEPEKTEPEKTEPEKTEPEKTEPEKTEPEKTEPEKTEPEKTEPQKTEPEKTEPEKTEPEKTESEKTEPEKTEPEPTEPEPTEPEPTEPESTEPEPTEPEPTEEGDSTEESESTEGDPKVEE